VRCANIYIYIYTFYRKENVPPFVVFFLKKKSLAGFPPFYADTQKEVFLKNLLKENETQTFFLFVGLFDRFDRSCDTGSSTLRHHVRCFRLRI
jgi:hypothetical protein